MKKQLLILIAALLALLIGACSPAPSENATVRITPAPSDSLAEKSQENTPAPTAEQKPLDVDKGLFNVIMTIPSDFMGEGLTQQQCDEIAKEKGYKSITLNSDGSATYVVTAAQHAGMMDDLRESINQGLEEMVTSGDFPNFVSVEANNTFTEFTVIIKSEELGLMDSFSVMGLYMFGGMYNTFNGTPADNISVSFVNETSGNVINTANSRDLKE